MSQGTQLLVSFAVLAALIGFVVWRYWTEREEPNGKTPFDPSGRKDDLTRISGIGPTLQRKLNEIGITSFQQIADFTGDDIARVNEVLSFKGRIEREEWVSQAASLVKGERTTRGAKIPAGKTAKKRTGKKAAGGKKARKAAGTKTGRKLH